MMIIELDGPRLADVVDERLLKRVVKRALRRTATGVRHQGVQQVREEIRAKAKDVRAAIEKRVGESEARVSFFQWFLPVDSFRHWQTKQGVSVRIKSANKTIKGAFVFRGRNSGKRLVGMRYTKSNGKEGVRRLFTTGISAVATNEGFMDELAESAEARFNREVVQDLDFFSTSAI